MNVRGVLDWAVGHFRVAMAILFCAIALMLLAIVIILVTEKIHPVKTIVDLNIAPMNSSITLNGTEYKNGTYEVDPGVYHLKISADGFDSKEYDINVEKDKTNSITDYLLNSENGLEYYTNSEIELAVLRASNNDEAKQFVADFDRKYALRYDMPFEYEYGETGAIGILNVRFGDKSDGCSRLLCIVVSGYDDESPLAAPRMALSEKGYDISDYEVIYEN